MLFHHHQHRCVCLIEANFTFDSLIQQKTQKKLGLSGRRRMSIEVRGCRRFLPQNDTGRNQLLSGTDRWSQPLRVLQILVATVSPVVGAVLLGVCLLSGSVNKWFVNCFLIFQCTFFVHCTCCQHCWSKTYQSSLWGSEETRYIRHKGNKRSPACDRWTQRPPDSLVGCRLRSWTPLQCGTPARRFPSSRLSHELCFISYCSNHSNHPATVLKIH